MNPTVLDVLLYLFEQHLEDAEESPPRPILEELLRDSGFPPLIITQALDWLEALAHEQQRSSPLAITGSSHRVFAEFELARLNAEARGFLLHLEQIGVLDPAQREVVIERLMALDEGSGIEEVKWVVLLTLFRQPGQEAAFARMEDMLYADLELTAH